MGLRGPQPVGIAELKAHAVQWAYFLHGLRDGQPCPNEKIAWSGWRWRPRGRLPKGMIVRIPFARVFLSKGIETAERLFEVNSFFPAASSMDGVPWTGISEKITKRSQIPQKCCFDLSEGDAFYFVFLPVPEKKELWNVLLTAEGESDLKEVANRIARWIPPIPGHRDFRNVLKKCSVELGAAKHVWFYPRDLARPSSDDKRIEFFAKTLAGLMLGVAPATAAKKLSQWKLPKLWITDFEKVS